MFPRLMMSHKVLQDQYVFETRVVELIRKLNLAPNSAFLLSVSGGSDSMAMLHIFKSIQESLLKDISLKVVNFNHKARVESDEEVGLYVLSIPLSILLMSF